MDPIHKALVETLADLFPRESDQRRLIRMAGLREAQVAFDPVALTSWSNIAEEAKKQRSLHKLIADAASEYPNNDALASLLRATMPARLAPPSIHATVWRSAPGTHRLLEQLTGDSSTLVPVSYLEVGLERARAVAKIRLSDGSSGSGFLTHDNLLITNNHVLQTPGQAAGAIAIFNFQQAASGADHAFVEHRLSPNEFFKTSVAEDWTIVRVADNPVEKWGAIELRPSKIAEGARVNIIQHPSGGPKQVSLLANLVVSVGDGLVQYLTDTLPGSSGSPVFDTSWNVVAVHHSGGWMVEPNGDPKHPFLRNEGILIDRIIEGFKS